MILLRLRRRFVFLPVQITQETALGHGSSFPVLTNKSSTLSGKALFLLVTGVTRGAMHSSGMSD